MVFSFLIFLGIFTLIGVSSCLKRKDTRHDYYLASNNVPPWLVGLSAVATNNSGYMFIGVIGYTYVTGLASIWLMIGWISGDFLASLFVHKRLRIAAEKTGEVSYSGVLSSWHGESNTLLQKLIGLTSLFFLLTYAAAQLVAGSKALFVLLDWPLWSGAIIGAILVSLYCFAGGIRASIWTDAAQSIVMIIAMGVLLFVTLAHLGGMNAVIKDFYSIQGFMDWVPPDLAFGGIAGGVLFIVSWLFAGFSVIGQPHIMVRFMTLNNSRHMVSAKIWYYCWFTAFYCMATAVGMLARLYLSDTANFDAELALPTIAAELLHPTFVGLILAGIFAATMSTADSLILSCSAVVTHDLLPQKAEKTVTLKITTIAITGLALALALSNNDSVFNMVIMAWSGLASAFAPLLIVLCFNQKPQQSISIIALISGFLTALLWRHFGLHASVYEGLPGICVGLSIHAAGIALQKKSV